MQLRSGLTLQFVNANPMPAVLGQNPLPYPLNVYVGPPQKWRENVTHFGTVTYLQVYPGIDIQWNIGQLRIMVAPGGDLSQLIVQLNQQALVSGDKVTAFGEFFTEAFYSPKAYQESANTNSAVTAAFVAVDRYSFGVKPGAYDRSRPLVIEIGSNLRAYLYSETVRVANDGSVLLAGRPTFLAKLNPDGSPAFLTRLGGVIPYWIGSGPSMSITMAGFLAISQGEPDPPITPGAPECPSDCKGWIGRFDAGGKLRASIYADTPSTYSVLPPAAVAPDGSVYFATLQSIRKWRPGEAKYAFSAPVADAQNIAINAAGEIAFSTAQRIDQPTTPEAIKSRRDFPSDVYAGKLNPATGAVRMATYVPVLNLSPSESAAERFLTVSNSLGLAPDGAIWIGSEITLLGGQAHTLIGLSSDGTRIFDAESISFLPTIGFDPDGGVLLAGLAPKPNLPTTPDAPLRASCDSLLYFSKRAADRSLLRATYLSDGYKVLDLYGSDRIYVSRYIVAPSSGFPIKEDIERIDATAPVSPGIACLIDPASRQHMFAQAPGDLVTIVGEQLGPLLEVQASIDAQGNLPRELAGVQVLINNIPAPILSVQQGLLTFYLPQDTPPNPQTGIQIIRPSLPPIASTIRVEKSQQFEALTADGSGSGFAAAMNQDGTANSAANPARVGSIVSIFGVGNTAPTSILLGRFSAEVTYSGPAPGLPPGVLQVNLRVPNGAAGFLELFPSQPHVSLSVVQ